MPEADLVFACLRQKSARLHHSYKAFPRSVPEYCDDLHFDTHNFWTQKLTILLLQNNVGIKRTSDILRQPQDTRTNASALLLASRNFILLSKVFEHRSAVKSGRTRRVYLKDGEQHM